MTTPTPWDSRTLRTAFATGDEMVVQPAAAGSDFVRLPWSVLEDLIAAAGGLTQSQTDGRIAAWARITPIGEVPDGSISDDITRDTELGDYALLSGATFLGLVSGLDPVDAQNFVTKAHGDANYATSGGFTLRTGNGAPATSLGDSDDWYLRQNNGQWYQKVNTTWHGRYLPLALSNADPEDVATAADSGTSTAASRADHVHIGDGAGGGGVALSDDDPLATSTSADSGSGGEASRDDHIHVGLVVTDLDPEDADGTAADAGTSPMAARADHIHEVPSATTSVEGISERATGDEARGGTDTTRHMTPQRVAQVFTDRAGDATPEDVGTADTGTATNFSREDHVHGGGTGGGGGPDLYDTIPPSIGEDGSAGTSADASRGDHTHGGQRAVSDNTPEDIGTAAPGSHAAASRSDHVHGGTVTTTDATLSDADPEDTGTTAPGTSDDVSRSDHVHESAGGGGGGAGLSDIAAEGVTETPSAGTGTDASRWDHEHDIPFNSTLEWDSNSQFGVRVQDVIEHLQERIRYFTFATGTSDAGATVGAAYTTSGYRKLITKVDVNFAASSGSDSFVVRLDELNSDNSIKAKLFTSATRPTSELGTVRNTHHFLFHNAAGDVGVPIDASIRLGVLLSRLGDDSDSAVHAVHGTESSSSPDTTYADAEVDFDYVTSLVYQHINPAINADTHSHGTDIRGNIKIYYTLILDHGNFVVGTDDQNAGEVPVTATGFTGNLSATDTDVQTALDTIDALSVGGGGAITQATETALGGVRGATAVQAIASSGTTILGWTNNRIRQILAAALPPATAAQAIAATGTDRLAWTVTRLRELVTAALPTMTQTDIDNATTDRRAVTGELIAANAGGGGGDTPDRIVLADAVGVSNTAGPHEIALTEAMVARQWISFFAFTTAGASPDGIGYLLSDDILALTAEATAPTNAENALPVVTGSYSASNFTQQSGNYFVFRKDDSTLWIRPTRLTAHALTITATPMGGGGTGAQLSGGLTEQVIVGSRLATTEYGLGTLWTGVVDAISPTISPPIDPDNLLQIAVGLRIDTEAAPELIISGAGIRRITHTNDPLPSTAVSSDEIPGAYYSTRVSQNNEDRGIEINPTLSWMEKRRQADRYGILFAFTENAAGNLTSIRPFVSAAVEIDIEYIVAIIGA